MNEKSYSESYKAAGVDITAGYRAVELMKSHIARTKNEGCLDDIGGFGGLFGLNLKGYEEPVLVSGTDGVGTKPAWPSFWTSTTRWASTAWPCVSMM